MKIVIQRVKKSCLTIEKHAKEMGRGMVLFVGVDNNDTIDKIEKLFNKIINLRIFPDNTQNMNLSIKEINGSIMLISNFTLSGSVKKGRRPDFSLAMGIEKAREYFKKIEEYFTLNYKKVILGRFQSMMDLEIHNNGPVTFFYEL